MKMPFQFVFDFENLLTDPEGDVCIRGSEDDLRILNSAMNRLRRLQHAMNSPIAGENLIDFIAYWKDGHELPEKEFDATAMRSELAKVSTWLGKLLIEVNQ